jgi:hypothetical protein
VNVQGKGGKNLVRYAIYCFLWRHAHGATGSASADNPAFTSRALLSAVA